MSNTTIKNIILSQPKVGAIPENQLPTLPHSTEQTEFDTVVTVEIPGVDPSTVDVCCENNILIVRCSRGEVILPINPSSDASKIKADILWGLLTIHIPLPPAPVSHSIKVSIHDTVKKAASKFTDED